MNNNNIIRTIIKSMTKNDLINFNNAMIKDCNNMI